MPLLKPLSRTELASKYHDETWREKFLDVLSIVEILSNCVIEAKYKVSDDLNLAIVLSDAGRRVRDQLITKEEVETKDANLLCLLGLVHVEPLIDIEAIDVDRLSAAISAAIVAKRMRFPMIFGRSLYDRAAELFKEERSYLRHDDTMKLIGDVPQGVFQAGHFLLGPYGLIRLEHGRDLSPRLSIALQHCADLSCAVVHNVRLTTSRDPGVNRNRSALHKVMDQISKDPSDWKGFLSDITEDVFNPYEENDQSTLPHLIGDAFDDHELKIIVREGVTLTQGRLLARAREFGLSGSAENWVEGMGRSHLMQLLLTEENRSLAKIIDFCVRSDKIRIPPGEIRRPMINHRVRSGTWRLGSEVSSLGYRAVASRNSVTLLRLSALARSLFDRDSPSDMDDLAWILRETKGATPTEKLESYLRRAEPSAVLRQLVLARRGNASKAAESLGIAEVQPDDLFVDVLLWKLGFSPQRREDIRDEYWQRHDLLESVSRTAGVNPGLDEDELRGQSSNYFVALERFLFDSLVFATWSLLEDHFRSERPFHFYPSTARDFTIAVLNESVDQDKPDQYELSKEPRLRAIVQGFIRLSKHLESLREREPSFLRQSSEMPKFVNRTSLQRFPFNHSVPFLDLTASSQVHISRILGEVGRNLNDSGIMTARNGLLHAKYEQRTPTIDEVNEALTRARRALDQLEEIGCVRTTFEVSRSEWDPWGRGTTVLHSHGREIKFSSPSGYDMLGLPTTSKPLYLMQGAVFAAPNEVLRFREGFESRFSSYWTNFPVRPEPGNRAMSSAEADDVGTDLESVSAALD